MQRSTFAAMVIAAGSAGAASAALLTNGDFEAGNTGFASDYAYRVVSDPPHAGQYGVTTSSFAWTNFWGTIATDHTPGAGDQFLIADIGADLSQAIWRQTVAVAANTEMTLSAWLATWTTFPAATLRIDVNGSTVGTWAAPGNAAWAQYTAGWNTGASTSATITIYSATYHQPGGDVAIDDIELVPSPGAASLLCVSALIAGGRRRRAVR
ncbi:MAG TPA: hypothetical protein VD971_00485 [Phycisphaerales bacterium]|nr:hypothetical protein [Phycisphaerales bacterium]